MTSIGQRATQALVREMPESERPISEQFRIVAKKWVDADAAANLLEDTKSSVLSQLIMKQIGVPVTRAEHVARASQDYLDHIAAMVEARKQANLLKVQMEFLKMRFHEWNSSDANQRAEKKFTRQAT
mgnify:CR=1 FL=1